MNRQELMAVFIALFLIPETIAAVYFRISFDILLSLGSSVLTIAMLPMVLNKKTQVPFWGSFPTAIVLTPYFSLLFWYLNTPIMSIVITLEGLLWWWIVFRRGVKKESTPVEEAFRKMVLLEENPGTVAGLDSWNKSREITVVDAKTRTLKLARHHKEKREKELGP